MNYLIDTNICIYILNERPFKVIQKFKTIPVGTVGVSSITVAELQYGISKSKYKETNQKRLNEFLVPLEILSFDVKATRFYGELRYQMEKSGKTIGPLDMLIAAHAISEELVFVTNNENEFKRVKGLTIENWC